MRGGAAIQVREAPRLESTPAPWNVPEDIRMQSRYLRDALRRTPGQPVCVGLTSLSPEEGASWVAAKLACAFAEDHEQTLLVDANRRHPSQRQNFNLENESPVSLMPGLRCYPSTMADLWIAAATQDGCEREAVANGYNLVVDFDCLKHSADASANRMHLDGVVLIVESEKQRREAIANAIERLRISHVEVLGVVVNRKRHYLPESIYRIV